MTTYGLLWGLGCWLGVIAMMVMLRIKASDFRKPGDAFSILCVGLLGFLLWPLAIPVCLWIETRRR